MHPKLKRNSSNKTVNNYNNNTTATNDNYHLPHGSKRMLVQLVLGAILALTGIQLVQSMGYFQVKINENNDGSRLIATSSYNYALTSPKLLAAKSWRAVSVNGEQVMSIIKRSDGGAGEEEKLTNMNKADLSVAELELIEQCRNELLDSQRSGTSSYTYVSAGGPSLAASGTHTSSSSFGGGGGSVGGAMMMSSGFSSSSGGSTTTSFSSSSSGGGNSETSTSTIGGSGSATGTTHSYHDGENFSVSKSEMPFGWSRVFVNGDLITIIYKDNGEVKMLTKQTMSADELAAIEQLRRDVADMSRKQTEQVVNTMQQSVDMVSNVFNNIMGRFPRPPDYRSAVGNTFGSSFPFGPNNSPFSSQSGWPFGGGGSGGIDDIDNDDVTGVGGGGATAYAFAG